MTDLPTMEFHILNFFRVKNDFASTAEMNIDFQRSGIPTGEPGFQMILDNGYLDTKRENGRFVYKLNDVGLARWRRLKDQFDPEIPFTIQNFRKEIEELLIEKQEIVFDLLPVIRKYCEGKSREEIHSIKAEQMTREIQRLKGLGHIEISDDSFFHLANAAPMADYESVYLKGTPKFYESQNKKDPHVVQNIYTTHGPNSPIAGRDLSTRDLKANEENPEGIKLAKKGLTLTVWLLICAVIAIGVTIAIYLLPSSTPK